MQASAFAPGNLSGIFRIVRAELPERMHALGMGFTVSQGVVANVEEGDSSEISFNGETFDFATVRHVVEALCPSIPIRVRLASPLPLSGGFGLSGASALATAFALDRGFGLDKSPSDLAMIAHIAEVKNLTGLGDVCGQLHGGCLIKLVPGDPLAARSLPVPEQDVFYRYFAPIHTEDILSDPQQVARINAAADANLSAISSLAEQEVEDFARYVSVARRFSDESGLLRHAGVRRTIEAVESAGGAASMIMLGNAVFATVDFEGASKTRLSCTPAKVIGR
ncbi:MAG: hypothetical protein ISN28_06500 [Ectothiorhodospiraceae bacterium AqS1]|nr:hypothetical protein [Ectothiorhodospiraceae bacterium AqS1]